MIDYYAIEEKIVDQLAAESSLSGVRFFIEPDFLFAAESAPAVLVYLDSRLAVETDQRLSAGRRVDYQLRISLWCLEYHMDSFSEAARLRDALISEVEVGILRDRTLKGSVEYSWLEGGDFESSNTEQGGFIMAGEVLITAKVNGTP